MNSFIIIDLIIINLIFNNYNTFKKIINYYFLIY
jgi:hypothetical protein